MVDRGTKTPLQQAVAALFNEAGVRVSQQQVRADGSFVLRAPEAGLYHVRVESPRYRAAVVGPLTLGERATVVVVVELDLALVEPVTLDTLTVAGRPVFERLGGFYRRRAEGVGDFLVREEIERVQAFRVTDVLRHLPSFAVRPNPAYGVPGTKDTREYIVQARRPVGIVPGTECPPNVFLDGMYVGTARDFDLDSHLDPHFIEAIEAYDGPAKIPVEFSVGGGGVCGAIAIWTADSRISASPSFARHAAVGAQMGLRVSRDGLADGRLGLRVVGELMASLEVLAAINLVTNILRPEGPVQHRRGWQVVVAGRIRPLGAGSPFYMGPGLTALSLVEQTGLSAAPEGSRDELHFLLLGGVSVPLGEVRPFVEAHLRDPFFKSGWPDTDLFAGISVRLY
ncbi:hypothetical protein HRbin33_00805 [bacterium HR33]|nr:hypothetical protein HRbin33_00805 [bacterium HR33]